MTEENMNRWPMLVAESMPRLLINYTTCYKLLRAVKCHCILWNWTYNPAIECKVQYSIEDPPIRPTKARHSWKGLRRAICEEIQEIFITFCIHSHNSISLNSQAWGWLIKNIAITEICVAFNAVVSCFLAWWASPRNYDCMYPCCHTTHSFSIEKFICLPSA